MTNLCVITGTSRGIGRATALELARRGADLALLGRPGPAHDDTVRACRALGVDAVGYTCDVADGAAIERAAADLVTRQGPPAAVIHNAGILERGAPVQQVDPAVWRRVIDVNLTAPFLLTRALLPAMLAAGRGRLVFVSSISGTIGSPGAAHYAASKWGVIGLMKSLAEELAETPLSAVAVLPGSVDTDMLKQTPFTAKMSPEEVASVIAYHALEAPRALTGACVEVFG